MCGIFGICAAPGAVKSTGQLEAALQRLFVLSESRGKEAAGLAVQLNGRITVFKEALAASRMIKTPRYKRFLQDIFGPLKESSAPPKQPLALIGHSRLVTNGLQTISHNNQPVIKDGLVAVHNGIITNPDLLWSQHPQLQRLYDVDTEVLLAMMHDYASNNVNSWVSAVRKSFAEIQGTASVGVLSQHFDGLTLATNNGSLYIGADEQHGMLVFASERYILQQYFNASPLHDGAKPEVRHVDSGTGFIVRADELRIEPFSLNQHTADIQLPPLRHDRPAVHDISQEDAEARHNMRRCTKCILPETMPFIHFDEEGVCNYCRNYQPMQVQGHDALEEIVAPHRGNGKDPDCIVMFSGGRDSSYGLHYITAELGMNPLAYTYDWGVITDLGRRNQARLCGKLGVEHVLISADIPFKRKNIRMNIEAWLRKPDLGMVPLFMAGDKQYYYYANQLREHNNIPLVIVCECPLELTRFKAGFCGVDESQARIFNISLLKKFRLLSYYGRQYLSNPAYFNRSLRDNFFAFRSSYFIKHDYTFLYRYVRWEEAVLDDVLIREYEWETDPEIPNTWRIGDGTAAFYNYIYYNVAGLTENDTLRSNQIREGVMTREQALEKVERENQTRWQSLDWYARIIGFDLNEAIRVINAMPKLYRSYE